MSSPVPHILVAEDNPALGSVIRFNLTRADYQVTLVRNGMAAWEAVQKTAFDLVVTDQQMPIMNGADFCQRMRELDPYHHTPVILLTAKGLELDAAELRDELGITAVVSKPFSPSRLVSEVKNLLSGTPADAMLKPEA